MIIGGVAADHITFLRKRFKAVMAMAASVSDILSKDLNPTCTSWLRTAFLLAERLRPKSGDRVPWRI